MTSVDLAVAVCCVCEAFPTDAMTCQCVKLSSVLGGAVLVHVFEGLALMGFLLGSIVGDWCYGPAHMSFRPCASTFLQDLRAVEQTSHEKN